MNKNIVPHVSFDVLKSWKEEVGSGKEVFKLFNIFSKKKAIQT